MTKAIFDSLTTLLTQLIPATGVDDHDKIAALIYQAIGDQAQR